MRFRMKVEFEYNTNPKGYGLEEDDVDAMIEMDTHEALARPGQIVDDFAEDIHEVRVTITPV